MFNKLTVAAVAISGLMMGSSANANEKPIDSIVSNLVAESMAQVKLELRESITASILKASYSLSLPSDETVLVASRVKIRDIKEASQDKQHKSD